jgi:hypothetical protein
MGQPWYGKFDSDSAIANVGLLVASLVSIASPLFIMAVLLPAIGVINSEQQNSTWENLFLLVVGPVCALWAVGGMSGVVISLWRLLLAGVTAVDRWI